MAEQKQKANAGALFGNQRKEKETHPDWQGNIFIDPALAREQLANLDPETGFLKLQISGWTNKWNGGHYFSLSVAKPYVKQQSAAPQQAQQAAPAPEVPDEEIPF